MPREELVEPGFEEFAYEDGRFPIGEGRGETRVRAEFVANLCRSRRDGCANYSRTLKALLLAANRMVVLPHLGTMAIVCRRSACNGRTRVTKRASSFAHAHGPAACTCNRATVR